MPGEDAATLHKANLDVMLPLHCVYLRFPNTEQYYHLPRPKQGERIELTRHIASEDNSKKPQECRQNADKNSEQVSTFAILIPCSCPMLRISRGMPDIMS